MDDSDEEKGRYQRLFAEKVSPRYHLMADRVHAENGPLRKNMRFIKFKGQEINHFAGEQLRNLDVLDSVSPPSENTFLKTTKTIDSKDKENIFEK